jgi:antitoxin ChpS
MEGGMHIAKFRKVGGSVMVAIPPAILDQVMAGPEASAGVSVENGRIIIEPIKRKRYTLDELLAKCDPTAPMPEKDELWMESPPVGDEFI